MPKFGKKSKLRLLSCDYRLQNVLKEVIKYVDCSVLEGHRGEKRQNELFIEGKTKVKYPNGRHNAKPSRAVDVVPALPVDADALNAAIIVSSIARPMPAAAAFA